MKKLKGLEADLAFFPVDGRLGPSIDKGAKVFCAETEVRALVTMHSVGYPAWQPPEGFSEQAVPFPSGRRARRARRPASKMANSSQTDGRLLKT